MIEAVNLYLHAGERVLVADLNWQTHAGQCWSLIGRNGAGKSTLLRTLAGLRQPDKGMVKIKQQSLSEWSSPALARERAFLPQERMDAFSYSVIETVLAARYPCRDARYWESDEDYQIVFSALQSLDVAHLEGRDVRTLSGGERQRVAIAAVIAQDTPLLLLDEPVNALDLAHQVSTMNLLSNLCREHGKTVVMAIHDLNLAHHAATHALLMMDDGSWQAGPINEVMQASTLSRCLGHPIEMVQHGERIIYLPQTEPKFLS